MNGNRPTSPVMHLEVNPELLNRPPRRTLLRAMLRLVTNTTGALGMTILTGGYARFKAPFRIAYPEYEMPIANLPAEFEGFRILHLSDFHTGNATPVKFLEQVVEHANRLNKDLTVITGDFVTREMKGVAAAARLCSMLNGPVIGTLGNHDYNETHKPWVSSVVADALERELTASGITVLRNRAMPLQRGGGTIWVVGLEDWWSGKFDAAEAMRQVQPGEVSIALSHNPDTAHLLAPHGVDWILAGHTHGGQIRIPVFGSLALPVRDKRLDQGFRTVGRTQMFISRGVGAHIAVRFRCPPEAPIFVLRRK